MVADFVVSGTGGLVLACVTGAEDWVVNSVGFDVVLTGFGTAAERKGEKS